jgi:hypothetical protein
MHFVAVFPRIVDGSGGQHWQRRRRPRHRVEYELRKSRRLQAQLLFICDVLPRAAAARQTTRGREIGTSRFDPVRRRLDDLDCRRDEAFATTRTGMNANTLAGNRERNRDALPSDTGYAVAGCVDAVYIDNEILRELLVLRG